MSNGDGTEPPGFLDRRRIVAPANYNRWLVPPAALAIHLAFFGFAVGSVAVALAAATGRRTVATAGAAGFALLGFLINGFAPLVDAVAWLKYASPSYYYSGHDPLANGVDLADLAVLAAASAALMAFSTVAIQRRDLRG